MKDNQPKHRQLARERKKLERKFGQRQGYPTALIVCEGSRTEPAYISGLARHLDVNPANARIYPGDRGTDQVTVVNRAIELFRQTPDYDNVFAVVDGDVGDLNGAIALATTTQLTHSEGHAIQVRVLATKPCFEYWLLLHFQYTAKPYANCDEVTDDLRHFIDGYSKSDSEIFAKTRSGLTTAIERVKRLKDELDASSAATPDTDFVELYHALKAMSRSPQR